MEDFKVRLIEERDNLVTKAEKLEAFLDAPSITDPYQLTLLSVQHSVMKLYIEILNKRLVVL